MLFGDAAVRLCGVAAALLAWKPDDFWNATPAELAACLKCDEAAADPATVDQLRKLMRQFPDS